MLCSQCQAFWTAIENQISNSDSLRISDDLPGCFEFQWPRHSSVLHGSLVELEQAAKEHCHICFCIFHDPTSSNKISEQTAIQTSLAKDRDLEVALELQGSEGTNAKLCAKYQRCAESEAPGEVVAEAVVGVFDGYFADGDAGATLQKCSELDSSGTGSPAAFELALFWLRQCLSTHEKCLKAKPSPNFMPTRVLDVVNEKVRLVETAKLALPDVEREYLALSHCWGTTQIITSRNDNLKNHLEDIPFGALSKTFQEAVKVTRKLSFRYLWIDSLCIIQDNEFDWEQEAAQMCDIYRNATLTIGAAHASGGEGGCFFKIDGLRYLPLVVELNLQVHGQNPFQCRPVFKGWGRGLPYELSRYMGPALYGRAWVLQEQILSLRSLSFDGPKLRWSCLESEGSMHIILGENHMEPSFYTAIKDNITDQKDLFADREDYFQWYEAIREYTHRGMTVPSDRLFAVAGIADAIARTTKAKYCAGLWAEDLTQGLLWHIPHIDMAPAAFSDGAFDLKRNKRVRHETPLAPTWSWASVTVPVIYPPLGSICDYGTILPMCSQRIDTFSSTSSHQNSTITVTGHTRTAYVNSVYPESIPDARDSTSHMVLWDKPERGAERFHFTFCGHAFNPSLFFLFSKRADARRTEWQFMHGEWCPDEILPPSIPITFLAIAQRHDPEDDSITVHTVGLVPTGNSTNEYRRVGYAAWTYCSWYGYVCGEYDAEAYEQDLKVPSGWRGLFWRLLRWIQGRDGKSLQQPCAKGAGEHHHDFAAKEPLDMKAYHHSIKVRTRTMSII